MIQFKGLATLFISSVLQMSLVHSQWNGRFPHYEPNFIPYYPDGSSFAPGTIQYVPTQGSTTGGNTYYYPIQNVQPFEEPVPNTEHLSVNSPIYSNTPSISYQGLDQANALRSAYPNQPIIIINNGGNGDTGGNSNNGNNNGRSRGSDFNFAEIAALLFATHKGGLGGGLRGKLEPEPEPERPAPQVNAPQSRAAPQEAYSPCGCNGNNKCSTVTHITIVLPSLGGSVEVEQKKKKRNNKNGGKQKKAKNDEDSTKVLAEEIDSDEKLKDDDDDDADDDGNDK